MWCISRGKDTSERRAWVCLEFTAAQVPKDKSVSALKDMRGGCVAESNFLSLVVCITTVHQRT